MELTKETINSLEPPIGTDKQGRDVKLMRRYRDTAPGASSGLMLAVAPSGAKSWIQRISVYGKRHDIGLGGWPRVTRAEARKRATANRQIADSGGNPLTRNRSKLPRFQEAACQYHDDNRSRWKNGHDAAEFLSSLGKHVNPKIGRMPVDRVEGPDLLAVLKPIWKKTPSLGKRLKQRCSVVFDWCKAHGYVKTNPCDGLCAALGEPGRKTKHHAALPHAALPKTLQAVAEASNVAQAARDCFRLLVLTAVRSQEARGAQWGEVDLEARTWTIPAARMKAEAEHRVPLSDAALVLLEARRPANPNPQALIFPSVQAGKLVSDMSLLRCLEVVGLKGKATIHGMRSAFRDWAGEKTKHRPDTIEKALAHAVGSAVERAYARSDLFEDRQKLMSDWAQYLGA